MTTEKRKVWVDQLRGFCMIAILWFHTEMYYARIDITPYAFYVGDVLAVFFFLSGYLFWNGQPVNLKHKLFSIWRWLLIPYFVFTTLLAIPKALVHQDYEGWQPIVFDIMSGNASWFIATLIVSQLFFTLALHITRGQAKWLVPLSLLMLLASHFIGNGCHPSPLFYEQNLWHVNEAFLAFFLLTLGYYYHQYENCFSWQQKSIAPFLLVLCFVGMKILILQGSMKLILGPILVSDYPVFIIDLIISILLLTAVFKRIPRLKVLSWTGRHSIVYYFICGGVPLVTAMLFNRMNLPYTSFIRLFFAFSVVYSLSTLVVWIVYRYTNIVHNA